MRFQPILLILVAFILTVNGATERQNKVGPPPGFKPNPAPKPVQAQSGNEAEKKEDGNNENVDNKVYKKLTPSEAAEKLFGKRPKDSAEKVQKRIKDLEKVAGLIAEYKKLIKEKAEKSTAEIEPLMSVEEKERLEMMAAEEANAEAEKAKNNPYVEKEGHKCIAEINEGLQDYMVDGDILPTPKEMEERLNQLRAADGGYVVDEGNVRRAKRGSLNFVKYPNRKWDTTKPIAYFMDADLNTAAVNGINTAIKFFTDTTCYNFQKLSTIPTDSNPYIHFTGVQAGGCFSAGIGYYQWDPEHIVNLGAGCETFDTVEHEIGHRIALHHTQCRFDRDSYITVNMTNTYQPGQYEIETTDTNNNYNVTYEFGSMMHYGAYDFPRNPNIPVIRTKDPVYQNTVGQNLGATFADHLMMNRAFGCNKCPVGTGTAVCKNGGYPKPKLCSQCLCPPGWGGALCDQRKAASSVNAMCNGATLNASTTEWQVLEGSVTASTMGNGIWESCTWHIKAPSPDNWIALWIEQVATSTDQTCARHCPHAFTEFTVENFANAGARMCCQSQLGPEGYVEMTAKQPFAMISANSKWGKKAFRVWYLAY